MAITLKKINDELARLGHHEKLEKGDGYFYFWSGEAENWLDRTVKVPTLNRLTLDDWMEEHRKLKSLHDKIVGKTPAPAQKEKRAKSTPPPSGRKR